MNDLQIPQSREFNAAQYEAEQAERDFSEVYQAWLAAPAYSTQEDFAIWHASGYATAASRLVRALPVWDATAERDAWWEV